MLQITKKTPKYAVYYMVNPGEKLARILPVVELRQIKHYTLEIIHYSRKLYIF